MLLACKMCRPFTTVLTTSPMHPERLLLIRSLFDEYIEMYASRDDRLTTRFSENFSGYAGSSDVLVKDREEWIRITRQDFAQIPGRIRIEMQDLSLQDLTDESVLVTAFFHIHLPTPEEILSRETARLVLVFRREGGDWMIAHSGISIPYGLAQEGEIYPMNALQERNVELEALVEERTRALEDANKKLEDLSNTDGLTGIANRRSFDRVLAREWDRARRTGSPLALIMLDVDLFKPYNDHYGHVAGDACLQALAGVLAASGRRAGEMVARYGGEEFVILLPESEEDNALEVAHRVQQAIWALAIPHEKSAPGIVTASFGVASMTPSRQSTSEDLVRLADSALYRAKQNGRNLVQVATTLDNAPGDSTPPV